MLPRLRHATRRRVRLPVLGAVAVVAAAAGMLGAFAAHPERHDAAMPAHGVPAPSAAPATTRPAPTPVHTAPPTAPAVPAPAPVAAAALPPLPLAGCPPPPAPPPPPTGPPWHPAVLVPDDQLPAAAPPVLGDAPLDAIEGKGMWVWRWAATEGGDAAAVVDRARDAGLTQLWVRVADSRDGFYAAAELTALVPAAHAAGLSVIAWGFPYLYDPVGDAAWSTAVLDWRGPGGETVDGFSADVETASEGVALSARRVAVYLGLVRPARDGRPLVATVFPPSDRWMAVYPFATIAPYVDAFSVMVYWECRDPGVASEEAVTRLAPLRPVDLVGQAFDMADVGGRPVAPSGDELRRFMDVGRAHGSIGASYWVWQDMTPDEWAALGAYAWPGAGRTPLRAGAAR